MHLEHSFSNDTRHLFIYRQYCWKCGCNGSMKGGLEIHHICGRKKHEMYLDSPFNACVLCKECHDHVTHSDEERLALFRYTVKILKEELYKPRPNDILFLYAHAEDKFHVKPQVLVEYILTDR